MFTNEEKSYLLKYAAQRWGVTYNDVVAATIEDMQKTAGANDDLGPLGGHEGGSSGVPALDAIKAIISGHKPEYPGDDVRMPIGELTGDQRTTLGIAGLGGAYGAGALALNRIRKARMAEEAAAALAAKGGGMLGKLRALLG